MIVEYLRRSEKLSRVIYQIGKIRAVEIVKVISPFLKEGEKLIDIGSGTCNICELLKEKFEVVPLDILDYSFVKTIKPIIYDGNLIPFNDNTFDVALILTTLHHSASPEKIILEAMRVSKRIVIIEDIYHNNADKYKTYFLDSLLNLDFWKHPHSNKTDNEWRQTFAQLNLNLIEAKYNHSFFRLSHGIYYLENKGEI